MPTRRPDPLEPELAEYVDAFRRVEQPMPETAHATWRAIEARTSARPRRIGLAVAALVAVAAMALAVVFVDWRAIVEPASGTDVAQQTPYRDATEPTAGNVVQVPPPRPIAPKRAADPDPAEVEEEPASDVDPPPLPKVPTGARPVPAQHPKRPKSPRSRSRGKSPPPVGPSALAEETALLGRIQNALKAKDGVKALALVREHGKQFPRGKFRHEATVAKARALCTLGRTKAARDVAQRFEKAHPGSHLAGQMRTVCAGTND